MKILIAVIVAVLACVSSVFAIPDYRDYSPLISRPEGIFLWLFGISTIGFLILGVYAWFKHETSTEKIYMTWFKIGGSGFIISYLAYGLLRFLLTTNLKMMVLIVILAPMLSGLYSIIKAYMIDDQKYSIKGLKRIFAGTIALMLWAVIVGVRAVSSYLDGFMK